MNGFINLKIVSKLLSINLFVLGVSLLLEILIALIYSESIVPFEISSGLCFSLGIIFMILSKGVSNESIQKKDAFISVTLTWILSCVIGALPYVISGYIPSFVNAFFESTSGFTTTGSSILNNIEALPKSLLFWRSLTHWIGGIGIIILVIVVLPSLKFGGYHLFTSESSFQGKIKPKIRHVGLRIIYVYLSLTLIETFLLLFGDMSLFESICHSFGTVSTGGFSPKNTSITNYSPYIQYVITIFMFLSGINFAMHYYFFKRDYKKIKENSELWFYVKVTLLLGFILTFALFFKMNKPFEESFREAFFQIVSIITSTGFATADYLNWPKFAIIIIFLSLFLGACTGSTSGGIKMVRHLLYFKKVKRYFNTLIHTNAYYATKLNNKDISVEENNQVIGFIGNYIIVFIVACFLLITLGVDYKTAAGSAATCMAGVGPGIGLVGPANNFSHLTDSVKIVLCIVMIIGRLEIYSALVLFTKVYWKK